MERMVEVVVKSSILSGLYNDWVMSKKRELSKSYRINWGVSPEIHVGNLSKLTSKRVELVPR